MEIIQGSLEEVRKIIARKASKKEKVIVQGKDIGFNRKILENKKVNMLILSHTNKKDTLKERDSGLNQVLCKIARENNITFAMDFKELEIEDRKERAKILGRIIQNLKLARKYKNKLIILNKPNDKLNLQALLQVLGLDTKMASELSN